MYIISQGMMLWREVFVLEWFSPNFITDVYQLIPGEKLVGLDYTLRSTRFFTTNFGCRLVNEHLGGWSQVVACFPEMSITRVLQLDMFLHRDGHLFWPKNCWMFGFLLVHNKRRSTSQKSQFRHCRHSKWLFLGFRINIFWKSSRRNKATETFSAAMIQDSLQSLSYKVWSKLDILGRKKSWWSILFSKIMVANQTKQIYKFSVQEWIILNSDWCRGYFPPLQRPLAISPPPTFGSDFSPGFECHDFFLWPKKRELRGDGLNASGSKGVPVRVLVGWWSLQLFLYKTRFKKMCDIVLYTLFYTI